MNWGSGEIDRKHYRVELYGGRLDGLVMQHPYSIASGDVQCAIDFANADYSRDWYVLAGSLDWGGDVPPAGFLLAAKIISRRGEKLNYIYHQTTVAGQRPVFRAER